MKNRRLWWMLLAPWTALLLLAASCGDDGAACSLDDHEGCEAGQVCLQGPDGEAACYCSLEGDSGCADGLECQAVEGESTPGCFCSRRAQSGCEAGLVCEQIEGGNTGCFEPVTVKGLVFDLSTGAPIAGALVAARDANNVAVSDVAETDAAGNYELVVLTDRTADGQLVKNEVALRADADGYLSFPKPPRVAIPFDTANATGTPPVLESGATEVGLTPLDSTAGLGTIQGTVLAERAQGTLVVAGGSPEGGGGVTGIAGFDGSYTVFNVPAGSVAVSGYAAGLQLAATSAEVTAGQVTTGVDLEHLGVASAVVSGKVEIVNPGMGEETSVIMVVDETFDENVASGEAPPGLRAYPVTGAFEIPNVPDGNYVMLAAFENDFLVRDPDQSIGGTQIVRVTVSGGSVELPESFKVTGALDVVSPDGEEVVSGTPTFVFADDSGEDSYEIVVYDVFGNLVWEQTGLPKVTGSATVEIDYGGPALESGVIYQFRATSIKLNGQPISRTEDLRGVFLYQ